MKQTKYWSVELLKPRLPEPEKDVQAARYILAGALRAWQQVSVVDDDAIRNERQQLLKTNVLPTLRNSRAEGTRSSGKPAAANVEVLGKQLTDLLSRIPE